MWLTEWLTEFLDKWLDLPSMGFAEAFDLDSLRSTSIATLVSLFIGSLLTATAVMLTGSVISAFLRFHGFTLTRDGDQLRTRAGLLTISERSMNRNKVQLISIRQSWPRRWLNRVTLELRQAGGHAPGKRQAQRNDSHNRLFIPLAQPDLADTLFALAFDAPASDLNLRVDAPGYRPISRRYIRARIALFGLIPVVIMVVNAQLWHTSPAWYVLPVVWLIGVAILTVVRYRRWGVQCHRDALAVRSGWLGRRVDTMACQKMQSIELSATPWQRRAGVTNLTIRLASHNLSIPYLPRVEAARLRDYLMYQVQRSEQHSF